MFQTSFATLLAAPAAALGDRSAVCSFLLPAYANRLWPRLSPLFATLELELPGFRGWSHFTSALLRAKAEALATGAMQPGDFAPLAAEVIHIQELRALIRGRATRSSP